MKHVVVVADMKLGKKGDVLVTHALGIQFQPMPPNLSGLLLVFADNLYHAS